MKEAKQTNVTHFDLERDQKYQYASLNIGHIFSIAHIMSVNAIKNNVSSHEIWNYIKEKY
jgi:hypothetical protein